MTAATKRTVLRTFTVPGSSALSSAIDLGESGWLVGLMQEATGSAWTSSILEIHGATTESGTYRQLYDRNGNKVQIVAAAMSTSGGWYVDLSDAPVGSARFIKLNSATAQASARTVTAICLER